MVAFPYIFVGIAAAGVIAYLSLFSARYELDLSVYRGAVSSWELGRDPYDATFTPSHLFFTYPPFSLLGLAPLASIDLMLAACLLWAAGIAAITAMIVLVFRYSGTRVTRRLWCLALGWSCVSILALEPVRSDMDYGQIELVLMLLVVADLLLVPRRSRGVLIGVASAVKLTPLVFIVVLIVMRDWKSATRAVAAFAGCTALAWAFWPVESRDFWLHYIFQPDRIGVASFAGNQSWYAIVNRLAFLGGATQIVWLALSLATISLCTFIAWRCATANQMTAAMVVISLMGLLASPISWSHHWVWVVLIPPVIIARTKSGDLSIVQVLLLAIVILTCAAPYWWFKTGVAAQVLASVLPLYAGTVLAVWAAAEWKDWRAAQGPPGITAR